MSKIAIEVKNVRICYKTIKKMSYKNILFKLRKQNYEVFEALKDISFTVNKGEIIGIVGKNGSGKSTLLLAIAGIFSPDEGSIELFGNSVSLMSIGVGFQKKLSGRENIYLSGLLLGFSKEYIDTKIDEIIKFSELDKFIDKPVRTYSSGMYSKLAFSITACLETDIILLDEVLSVGDAKFKKKSYAKMKELISHEDRTVLIVSHNSETIKSLCDKVIWLDEGRIVAAGDTLSILEKYNES
ncbi:MAG: ABC transporter ATP-binding protein [Christensenellales bacterium]|jgi:ABC-type polysaccharide/polyol phosphate transport system ATPase subunit